MHQQASQKYWPGHSSSTPATAAQSTLPTPPSDGTDGFKPPGRDLKTTYNDLAAPQVQQQPGMASNLEPTGAPSSLTARRPAANNLPQFELPLPQFQHYSGGQSQKFVPLPALNATQNSSVNAGNLLTPPSNVPGDSLSPLSSALSGATAAQNVSSSSYNNYAWPPLNTGLTPLGLGSGTGNTPQPWPNPAGQVKGLFSPSLLNSVGGRGNPNSPTAGDSLPPPPWNMNGLPPLPASISMSPPGGLGSLSAQQNAMAQAYMAQDQTQTPTPISATTTQASPVNGTDAYAQRPHSNPSAYYSQSQPASAQQPSFPPFNNNSSPTQHSPMSAPPQGSRMSPFSGQGAAFNGPAPANPYARSPYPPSSYSVSYPGPVSAPAQMSGPIMTNLNNPNNPMGIMGLHNNGMPVGMIGAFTSGHAAHMAHQMYGNPQQLPHNERPFKCDQCPQSFNRNHDLKRHKRIHLAVKPFPCGHCDKSFSRKDALKVNHKKCLALETLDLLLPQRHILVKGCGKNGNGSSEGHGDSPDTPIKSEESESDQSPTLKESSLD